LAQGISSYPPCVKKIVGAGGLTKQALTGYRPFFQLLI
jgi:hypothetical protein